MKHRQSSIIVMQQPRTILIFLLLWAAGNALSCAWQGRPLREREHLACEVIVAWNQLLLQLDRHTPGYRPPVSARMYAYMGIAAYQAALPGCPDHNSLGDRLVGLQAAKLPTWQHGDFDLSAAVNSTYAEMAQHFFPTAPAEWKEKIEALAKRCHEKTASTVTEEALNQSEAYGQAVAKAVWSWSTTDSVGHDGFLYNYDRDYTVPDVPGKWGPDEDRPMPPLLPHWGKSRAFVTAPDAIAARPPLPYDDAPGSEFYEQALELVSISNPLPKDHVWVAEFWGDDVPGLTVTPVGHWISIATQAIEQAEVPPAKALQIYLLTGLALGDAGVFCWNLKYRYCVARPQTYINKVIAPEWRSLHPAPSFPTYPSGHAMFGAAAAEVLSANLGDAFALTDQTHRHNSTLTGPPRSFKSFKTMAQENGFSRLLMGVHYRMDCEEGLRLGELLGKKVLGWHEQGTEKGISKK